MTDNNILWLLTRYKYISNLVTSERNYLKYFTPKCFTLDLHSGLYSMRKQVLKFSVFGRNMYGYTQSWVTISIRGE